MLKRARPGTKPLPNDKKSECAAYEGDKLGDKKAMTKFLR
jgi:hypothetical protein